MTGPFLIVTPLSVASNWIHEFEAFAPTIPVVLYHGTKEERKSILRQVSEEFSLSFHPVVVTSFEILIRDRAMLQKTKWKYLVVDEAHRLKNMDCRLIRELRQLQAPNRLLLTGTPLQNNLTELWSLLNFLLPSVFNDVVAFKTWFAFDEEITRMQESRDAEENDGEKETGNEKEKEKEKDLADSQEQLLSTKERVALVGKLHAILEPFLLRRLKSDVEGSLPPKKEIVLYIPLTKEQTTLYTAISDKTIRALLAANAQRRNNNKNKNKKKVVGEVKDPLTGESIRLLNDLVQLRKCCNHPFLFDWPIHAKRKDEFAIDERIVQMSGKIRLLDRLVPALLAAGHSVLLYSQMTRMLDVLESWLDLRGIASFRLDGTTPQHERDISLRAFQSKKRVRALRDQEEAFPEGVARETDTDTDTPRVFLLSTKAGGIGINLTAADTVILVESDWNPQNDLQAMDRCHRIGQEKPVAVFRLCMQHSVEEKILEKAGGKRMLEKVVMQNKKFKDKGVQPRAPAGAGEEEQEDISSSNEGVAWEILSGLYAQREKSKQRTFRELNEEEWSFLLDRQQLFGKNSTQRLETFMARGAPMAVGDAEGTRLIGAVEES